MVFIDLDDRILEFGKALHRVYHDDAHLAWFVPRPRELFEGLRIVCSPKDEAYLGNLEGVVVVSPDDRRATKQMRDLTRFWDAAIEQLRMKTPSAASSLPLGRVGSRGARMYDALHVVDDAVWELDSEFKPSSTGTTHVDINLFRARLRRHIQRTRYRGASALIAFDDNGDLVAVNYIAQVQHQHLDVLEQSVKQLPP